MEQEQGLKCSVCGGYLAPAKIVQDDVVVERIDSCTGVAKKSPSIQALLHGNPEHPLSVYVCNRCGLAYFFKEQQ